jgi:Fe-S cluster assembly ATP-binding protein
LIPDATILIPHYQRLLNEITPDFVHIMSDGKIIKTGSKELAIDLEKSGYDFIDKNTKEKEMAK